MIFSKGSSSIMAWVTVKPPTPESKMPIGLSGCFINNFFDNFRFVPGYFFASKVHRPLMAYSGKKNRIAFSCLHKGIPNGLSAVKDLAIAGVAGSDQAIFELADDFLGVLRI